MSLDQKAHLLISHQLWSIHRACMTLHSTLGIPETLTREIFFIKSISLVDTSDVVGFDSYRGKKRIKELCIIKDSFYIEEFK